MAAEVTGSEWGRLRALERCHGRGVHTMRVLEESEKQPGTGGQERQEWGVLAQQGESPHERAGEAAENPPRAEPQPLVN